MKINPEKVTVENMEFIAKTCEQLRSYYLGECLRWKNKYVKRYNAGKSDAFAYILDTFESLGIIEEDSEDEDQS